MIDFFPIHTPIHTEWPNALTLFNPIHLLGQTAPPDPDAVAECLDLTFDVDYVPFSCGSLISQYEKGSWDEIWALKVGQASPEFIAVMNISKYIAGPALIGWAITGIRDLYRNGLGEAWPKFASIILLAGILYYNNAAVGRNMIMSARALMNYQNEQIIEIANAGIEYEKKLQEIIDFGFVEEAIAIERDQCNGLTTNEEMLACLQNASVKVNATTDRYLTQYGDTRFTRRLKKYVKDTIDDPSELIGQALAVGGTAVLGGPIGGALGVGAIIIGKVANSASGWAAQGILASISSITQSLVELSWIFTAITLPIPLALSFYPGTRKVLMGWAVGFLTVGLFKLNLNLASSLVTSMIYARGPGAPVYDLALLSFGVIIMALAMTAGGGMAIFSGISTAIAGVSLGLISIATPKSGKL
ncbi:MAG: hypothetical protein WA901_03305 [Phormidesmis sp.]